MERLLCEKRPDWEQVVMQYLPASEFWAEGTYYRFSKAEIETLRAASTELHRMTLRAVDYAVNRPEVLDKMAIPKRFQPLVRRSWKQAHPTLYGRLDIAFDGLRPPKLIEYNGDSPALVCESGAAQWYWFEHWAKNKAGFDQFNNLHEEFDATWKRIKALMRPGEVIHFTSSKNSSTAQEDYNVAEYLKIEAEDAGMPATKQFIFEDIGWDHRNKVFIDADGQPITKLYKLYPWKWLDEEQMGEYIPESNCGFLEPPWKMLVDHKGLLALLWELFPGHPNLLPAFWQHDEALGQDYVTKPFFGCEGENIAIHRGEGVIRQPGTYIDNPMVYQKYYELPHFEGRHVILGSWLIGGVSCGICVRESPHLVTTNHSQVAPHVVAS